MERISFMPCSNGEFLQGGENSYFLSEGDSSGEARIALRQSLRFADNWNDLPLEKRQKIGMPFRFREGVIEKVLQCDKRFKNRNGEYTCGRPLHDLSNSPEYRAEAINTNGEFGFCVIEGFDVPDGLDCPYAKEKASVSFSV